MGTAVIVPPDDAFQALDTLRAAGHAATEIGEGVQGDGGVRFVR